MMNIDFHRILKRAGLPVTPRNLALLEDAWNVFLHSRKTCRKWEEVERTTCLSIRKLIH